MTNSQPSSGDLVRSSGWRVVTAAGLAVFMTTFDMTVVAVALPTIGEQLDVSPALGELLILAYAGAMVALALPAGRWVNTADARGAFVVAVGGFAVASAAAGLAPGFWTLVGSCWLIR